MRLKRILPTALLVGIIGILSAAPSNAVSLPYTKTRRQINAGVIVVPGHRVRSPFIFAVMDYRSDVKPRGWEFINPLAPKRDSAGLSIDKYNAAYWEVDLTSVASSNLARFDVLYFSTDSSQTISLTSDQRDKLNRFVDGGGLLWIDDGHRMRFDPVDGLFINLNFVSSGGIPWIPPQNSHHPLVSTPYRILNPEVGSIGTVSGEGIDPGFGSPTVLMPVGTLGSTTPWLAAAEYGSGRVVATACGVGGNISEIACNGSTDVVDPRNSNVFRASPAAMKLAYNIVSWSSSFTGFRKNARHTAYSMEGLNPALIQKWKLPYPPVANSESAPVFYKNCFFYTGQVNGESMLIAVDGAPEEDLDGDGNPDDGMPNPDGVNADIIWMARLGPGPASSPILFTMQQTATTTLDVVAVVAGDGNVMLFPALPVAGGLLDGTNSPLASIPTAGGGQKVFPPVYHNGWLYVAGGDSRIYAINPATSDTYMVSELDPPGGGMKSAPAAGFIHNKENGSEVEMVYTLAPPGNTGVGLNPVQTNDRLYGFPVFVMGERLKFINTATSSSGGSAGVYNTYLVPSGATKIADTPAPRVWYRNTAGADTAITNFQYNTPALGQFTITLPGTTPDSSVPVYASYGLDYSTISGNFMGPRVLYPFPPELNTGSISTIPMVRASGSLAFGPNGLLYVPTEREGGTSGVPYCSAIYAFAHDTGTVSYGGNSMTPKLKWAYVLHGGDPNGAYIPANSVPDRWVIDRVTGDEPKVTPMFRPVAYDEIPAGTNLTQKVELQGLQVKSAPAVAGDKLFVTATTDFGAANVARGVLLCFKANPDFVIRLNQPLRDESGNKLKVRLWQPDPSVPPSGRTPLEEGVTIPDNMVDYDTGTISISDFGNGILRTHGGSVAQTSTNVFTPSLPVWVIVGNTMVPPQQIDLSMWDNLLWFFVPQHEGATPGQKCSGIHSSPVVMGDEVYFTCDDGYVYAIDINNGKRDGYALGFQKDDAKYIKWQDHVFDGGGATTSGSMAGGNRLLAIAGSDGLYGFENPTTLVADNRRVVELDGGADISWACDSTTRMVVPSGLGFASALTERSPLNRPSQVHNFGPSDYLVVDAGNNQVIRMDKGGFISGSVSRFYVPSEEECYRYNGTDWQPGMSLMLSGEPTTLRGPQDALVWIDQEKWKDPNDKSEKLVNVIHWLIADTGNFRILDLVERYDMNKVPLTSPGNTEHLPELNWVTKTEVSQKSFAFNSVQLVQTVDQSTGLPIEEIWAAVGNYTGKSGRVGGSILRIPLRKRVNKDDPFLWQYSNGHDAAVLVSDINVKGTVYPLANPKYAHRLPLPDPGNPELQSLLICDDRGAFEVWVTPNSTVAEAKWGITSTNIGLTTYGDLVRNVDFWDSAHWSSYQSHIDVPLRAMKVQKLTDSVLITNGYSGTDADGYRFSGEVFEVKFEGGQPKEINWYAPRIQEEYSAPRELGGTLTSRRQVFSQGSPLEQPMSAERITW